MRVPHAFGAEFAVPPGYLNTPTVGIPPRFTAGAVLDVVQRWSRGQVQGADFDEPCATARAAFAQLAGVAAESVVMGASTSALVGLVAASVADGARVVCAEGDFTSLTFPFAAQVGRGVQVVEVASGDVPTRAGELRPGDVVAVSCVQSADGAIADLGALRDAVAGSGAFVVLDATQSAGWLDADVSWADAVVASGYKWLLSPRGAAWMALSPSLADQVVPHAVPHIRMSTVMPVRRCKSVCARCTGSPRNARRSVRPAASGRRTGVRGRRGAVADPAACVSAPAPAPGRWRDPMITRGGAPSTLTP